VLYIFAFLGRGELRLFSLLSVVSRLLSSSSVLLSNRAFHWRLTQLLHEFLSSPALQPLISSKRNSADEQQKVEDEIAEASADVSISLLVFPYTNYSSERACAELSENAYWWLAVGCRRTM
jgi:hypothetical protein